MPEDAAPQPSLIQQRLALQRRRVLALVQTVIAAVLLTLWIVVLSLDGVGDLRWLGAIAMLLFVLVGVFTLRNVRRDTRAFEAEHGTDAGVQKP
ncbi:hypothetical protein [Microbacterium sp. USHLN272]|uniref:hypothetical protein n=1 Tax=Microbacterium sp. USHLN272 TaxID=3081287 RepID=UPI00301973D2